MNKLLYFVLALQLSHIAIFDMRHEKIRNKENISVFFLSSLYFFSAESEFKNIFQGGIIPAYFFLVALSLAKLRKKQVSDLIGGGDIKLLLALIPAFGISMQNYPILVYAMAYPLLSGVLHILTIRARAANNMAFGPALIASFYLLDFFPLLTAEGLHP